MLLLQFNTWYGPNEKTSARITEVDEVVMVATHLHLPQALERVKNYERAFNGCFEAVKTTWRFIGMVPHVDPVDPELLDDLGVRMAENLQQRPEEFS